MAISKDNVINPSEIVSKFVSDVKNVVLSGAVHQGNPAYLSGSLCVPLHILGNINIANPNVGFTGSVCNAAQIYNSLVSITKILIQCGTYSFSKARIVSFPGTADVGVYDNHESTSGKAFFTPSFSANPTSWGSGSPHYPNLSNVDKANTVVNMPFSASSINQLIINCLNGWRNTGKPHYSAFAPYCHNSCHSNCHDECHSDCDHHCHSSCDDCFCDGVCYSNNAHDGGHLNNSCNCFS